MPLCAPTGKMIAQTLFLGASISSINVSKGWSGQASQLTVSLIEDKNPVCGNAQIINNSTPPITWADNHYHTCSGIECYISTVSGAPISANTPPSEWMLPGKVYYYLDDTSNIVSKYYTDQDPGFFGNKTKINTSGDITTSEYVYDIIGSPVIFKLGDFSFGGIVQSWSRTENTSGRGYSVNIQGFESILAQSYILLSDFAGAIYAADSSNSEWGGPRNIMTSDAVYNNSIGKGNIPNVFNIYGFLESMNKGGFGGANLNENGIEVQKIVDALLVLTSSTNSNITPGSTPLLSQVGSDPDYGAPKSAFSPFGRIVVKKMQEEISSTTIGTTFKSYGVIPPDDPFITNGTNNTYCEFLLDLSELPTFPKDYRIAGPSISILDFITQITEESGYDYHISMYRLYGQNYIKVHTIPRNQQPVPNMISNTVKLLRCNGYPVSSVNTGKELNESNARTMIIGGKQQRLYQAKSLRLAYTQSSYIYNPQSKKFVDYIQISGTSKPFNHGKIKFPNPLSTHNLVVSTGINPTFTGIYNELNAIAPTGFSSNDTVWNDNLNLASNQSDMVVGNYYLSKEILPTGTMPNRFYPIYNDVISPFFGYISDTEYSIDTSAANNEFKRIRPVYFDTWTGQCIVVLKIHELPLTKVNLEGFYTDRGVGTFIVTENEIRAALAGFDNFIIYSLSKTYKNDLIEMVRRAYYDKYKKEFIDSGISTSNAEALAKDKTNWYWNLIGGNIAGLYGQPSAISPDEGDGSHEIDEDAIQDLQLIHSFVSKLGEFYGKKYMVSAPRLRAYKDDQYADITVSTNIGDAYVFQGGGNLYYNYEPTNDGAWEEYGNIIDDTMVVGGNDWYNLTDDSGKIKPIIGYNANNTIDIVRQKLCEFSKNNLNTYIDNKSNDPFWNYEAYEYLKSIAKSDCLKFTLESLDLSSLDSSDYIIKTVRSSNANSRPTNNRGNVNWNVTTARDAWGSGIPTTGTNYDLMQKLYLNTSIEEGFTFLDPINLRGAKIIVDAPSIKLNSTQAEIDKDPNRTVISTVAMEDLSIYLHKTHPSKRNKHWIKYMLYYTGDINYEALISDQGVAAPDIVGSEASSNMRSSNFVEIAPKVAHPFFVGIPIKINQYSYGPWTNYPSHVSNIFPSGTYVNISDTFPSTCVSSGISGISVANTIDNWITPTKILVDPDLVPWNYGGSALLDRAALNIIEKDLNYQSILETAQIDLVGLPYFGLGMTFSYDALTPPILSLNSKTISYTDIKGPSFDSASLTPITGGYPIGIFDLPTTTTTTKNFNIKSISGTYSNTNGGPLITNIQTSIGQGGVTTTYTFRTYTAKVGLFNKLSNDKLKRFYQQNFKRNKQLAKINQQTQNLGSVQQRTIDNLRFNKAELSSESFRSKLFGWSPSTVLIAQAHPYLRDVEQPPISGNELYAQTLIMDETPGIGSPAIAYSIPESKDIGVTGVFTVGRFTTSDLSIPVLSDATTLNTSVGLYELKEVNAQLKKQYGLQSVMSLDGIFSPISFYPTLKNSTFHYGLYDTSMCPFCSGTKNINVTAYKRDPTTLNSIAYKKYCTKCGRVDQNNIDTLKGSATTTAGSQSIETLPPYIVSSGTDISILKEFKSLAGSTSTATITTSTSSVGGAGVSIPINLVTLNPIIVPYGNFRNLNAQNYTGIHPDGSGVHGILSYPNGGTRYFHDRCRHSIGIVGRGAVRNELKIYKNQNKLVQNHHPDYYNDDLLLYEKLNKLGQPKTYQMNQRFLGLRGPLSMHSWGYDLEGYPVPNAADEPYEIDTNGEPLRFKLKLKDGYPKKTAYKNLTDGALYMYPLNESGNAPQTYAKEYVKKPRTKPEKQTIIVPDQDAPIEFTVTDDTEVLEYIYEDDMTQTGFSAGVTGMGTDRTAGYQGSVVSKTQKLGSDGKWTEKKKLKDFYLNWGERPDLWPVGPIDLRWDSNRRVWTMKSSEAATIYKMVYVTLEEDLMKDDDVDDTYPARGFLDDLEYSTQPLASGLRRLVFVKDRSGYTAPRGAKLLCRYDKDTGFYEPVSKSAFIVKGSIVPGTNTATLEMSYAPGKKRGEPYPTMLVNFDNPFDLSTTNNKGLFTYMNSKWILTTSR